MCDDLVSQINELKLQNWSVNCYQLDKNNYFFMQLCYCLFKYFINLKER